MSSLERGWIFVGWLFSRINEEVLLADTGNVPQDRVPRHSDQGVAHLKRPRVHNSGHVDVLPIYSGLLIPEDQKNDYIRYIK